KYGQGDYINTGTYSYSYEYNGINYYGANVDVHDAQSGVQTGDYLGSGGLSGVPHSSISLEALFGLTTYLNFTFQLPRSPWGVPYAFASTAIFPDTTQWADKSF